MNFCYLARLVKWSPHIWKKTRNIVDGNGIELIDSLMLVAGFWWMRALVREECMWSVCIMFVFEDSKFQEPKDLMV